MTGLPIAGPDDDPARSESPDVIAHRGFAGRFPENTVLAAERAASFDEVALVEVDAVPTAAGTVVCFHDHDLHRTPVSRGITDARGRIWETDTETVLNATVLESGATVPRFETLLEALPDDVGVNVELKNPGSTASPFATALSPADRETETARWRPFVADVVESLETVDGPVLVSSFYEGALAALREVAPSLPAAVLVWDSLSEGLTVAERYDVEAVHPPWNLVEGTPFVGDSGHLDRAPDVDVDVVSAAHAEDRAVNVWTVETWYQADRLASVGVDGLIADYPGLLEITSDR
jgi:glycerophosphoryl diester phosphodiesterase